MKTKELLGSLFSFKSDLRILAKANFDIIDNIKVLPTSFFGEYKKLVILVWEKLRKKKQK